MRNKSHHRRADLDPPIRVVACVPFGETTSIRPALRRFFSIAMALAAFLVSISARAETIQQGIFAIHYEAQDEAAARKAADVLAKAVDEFPEHLPAGEETINVFICGTKEAFARYAGRYAQPKVGGIAKADENLIAVKTRQLVPGQYDYDGTLRHELVHILLARNHNVDELPRWLNEGIAMKLAKEHRWGSAYRVSMMYLQGGIIPYRELTWIFLEPGRETEFGDAYAQSLLMTGYLMERLGDDAFWQLIRDLDTERFGQAMEKRLGMIPPDFLEAWKRSLWIMALIVAIVSGFGLFQAAAILVIMAYIRKRKRGKKVLRQWEEEEREDERYGPVVLPWELETGETDGPWSDEDDEDEV